MGLILNMMLELVVVKILFFKVNMELNVLLIGILFILKFWYKMVVDILVGIWGNKRVEFEMNGVFVFFCVCIIFVLYKFGVVSYVIILYVKVV